MDMDQMMAEEGGYAPPPGHSTSPDDVNVVDESQYGGMGETSIPAPVSSSDPPSTTTTTTTTTSDQETPDLITSTTDADMGEID